MLEEKNQENNRKREKVGKGKEQLIRNVSKCCNANILKVENKETLSLEAGKLFQNGTILDENQC